METGSTAGSTSATSSIGALTTASSGSSKPLLRLRRGAPEATTGSSIRRSPLSRYRSKSFICIRNASCNGSTQAMPNGFRRWTRSARASGRALRRCFVRGQNLRLRPAVECLEVLVSVSQVVGELDHLETEPAWAETFRGQHDKGPDENFSSGSVQLPPRNHQQKGNALIRRSIGRSMSSSWAR